MKKIPHLCSLLDLYIIHSCLLLNCDFLIHLCCWFRYSFCSSILLMFVRSITLMRFHLFASPFPAFVFISVHHISKLHMILVILIFLIFSFCSCFPHHSLYAWCFECFVFLEVIVPYLVGVLYSLRLPWLLFSTTPSRICMVYQLLVYRCFLYFLV